MKSVRIALFAALTVTGSLIGSSYSSPAHAGGLGLDWLGNTQYVGCLRLMQSMSRGGGIWGPVQTGDAQQRGFDAGRRICNQKYYGHE